MNTFDSLRSLSMTGLVLTVSLVLSSGINASEVKYTTAVKCVTDSENTSVNKFGIPKHNEAKFEAYVAKLKSSFYENYTAKGQLKYYNLICKVHELTKSEDQIRNLGMSVMGSKNPNHNDMKIFGLFTSFNASLKRFGSAPKDTDLELLYIHNFTGYLLQELKPQIQSNL